MNRYSPQLLLEKMFLVHLLLRREFENVKGYLRARAAPAPYFRRARIALGRIVITLTMNCCFCGRCKSVVITCSNVVNTLHLYFSYLLKVSTAFEVKIFLKSNTWNDHFRNNALENWFHRILTHFQRLDEFHRFPWNTSLFIGVIVVLPWDKN